MISTVAAYVPGYRLKQEIQISPIPPDAPVRTLTNGAPATHKVTVFLEVEGAARTCRPMPATSTIMTSAALRRRGTGPMNRPSPALYLQDVTLRGRHAHYATGSAHVLGTIVAALDAAGIEALEVARRWSRRGA